MIKNLVTIALLAYPAIGHSQARQDTTSAHPWEQYVELLNDIDDIENGNLEDMYEQLCELESAPIDLNNATDDDIGRLFFLSDTQKQDLTEYIDRYKPLRSMGELTMIKSLDPMRIQLLQSFVYMGEDTGNASTYPKMNDIVKYGKNELVGTVDIPFYTRKGDKDGYLGYKYKHWLKYTFKYGQYLQIGLLGTQDAGEPFFANSNTMGYDHYAYYAIVRKMGRIKALAIGQYKIKFGLGLVANTGFSLGKTTATALSTPANSITPNSSRSDAYYLQGAAATIAASRHVDVTLITSYRKVDATLDDNGSARTLLKTGYHRTTSEMQRKHNTAQTAIGANIRWKSGGWHIGASGIYTTFNRTLAPNTTQTYRMYQPKGKAFYNIGADYGYLSHWLNISGETAINNDGAIATLNSIAVKATPSLTLAAIQRYYSYRYYSLLGSAFSDGGKVQNESGMYIGATWNAMPRLTITVYSDYAYFPWARYGASQASHSWDNSILATYNMSARVTLTGKYRIRSRQEDYTDGETDKTTLIDKTEHRARLALNYAGAHWATKTQIDAAYTAYPHELTDKQNSFGSMLSQTIGYNANTMSITANIGYFNTDDYNSRLYTYERGPLYTFSFPMFYGEGMRMALFARAAIGRNIVATCKIGATKYFDRDHISSSHQQIEGSWQTDMNIQIKCRF